MIRPSVELERVHARHPAETTRELVGRIGLQLLEVCAGPRARLTGRQLRGEAVGLAASHLGEPVAGRDVHHLARVPPRHLPDGPRSRGLHLHQRGVPLVGQNRRPQQPEASRAIDEERRVGVGIAGGVGQPGGRGPGGRAATLPGPEEFDVVGRTLARSVKPRDQQVPVRVLDDAGRVVVPVLDRKEQLGAKHGGWTLRRECRHGTHQNRQHSRREASLHRCDLQSRRAPHLRQGSGGQVSRGAPYHRSARRLEPRPTR